MPTSGPASSSGAPTRRRDDRIPPGGTLGRYTIEGVVGEGGMGVVYRARDGRLGRKVALKVISASDTDPEAEERIKRFLREARSAAALDHPNAVAIYDVGEADGVSFIAMELVVGKSLRAFVKATEPDVAVRVRWLVEVASALAAAHRARLIHRDVKPENVMIRDDGRAKVLDFGLARRAAAPAEERTNDEPSTLPRIHAPLTEDGQTTLTAVGTLLGTPQYMAPEQIRSEPLDGRSDQFSWGVVAYELLAGEPPWTGQGLHVMARILSDPAPALADQNLEVPAEVAAVVHRALSKAPADRFATMDELIEALDPSGELTGPGPRSLSPRSLAGRSVPPRVARTPTPELPDKPPENRTIRSADLPVNPTPVKPSRVQVETAAPREDEPESSGLLDEEPLRARGLAIAAAIIGLSAGAFIAIRHLHRGDAAPAGAASAAIVAPPRPSATAVTDLPAPRSTSAEAVAAYKKGLAELRFGGTRLPFEQATELDPDLAAAHLQFAVDATEAALGDQARAHFRKAAELRASLSERDQALLDAIEPVLLRQPSDWAEATRRLAAAVERFPDDAQLWYERGAFAQSAEGLDASTRYLERAVALDPKYAQALGTEAENLAYLGRFADARRALEKCAAIAPAYLTCAEELQRIQEEEGACEEEEATTRQLVTASAAKADAEAMLAGALAARGKPEAAVREALKMSWAAAPDADRAQAELLGGLALSLYAGDFAQAEQQARAFEAMVEPRRSEADHGHAARLLAQIYTETGRVADAGKVAEAFLGRRDAWEPDARSEDFAMAADATPTLLAAARRAGKLTRPEFAAKRAEWVRGWERRASPDFKRYVWPHGWAATVETPDDAREALAALPAYEPLPSFYPSTMVEAAVGRTFLLAGRLDDASAWLERAARACRVLEHPVEHTHAQLWLGMAREARGDKAGACAAYRVVRDRWGKARPPSVTFKQASDRLRALACPP